MLTLAITSPSAMKTMSLPLDPPPLVRQCRMASSNRWLLSLIILTIDGLAHRGMNIFAWSSVSWLSSPDEIVDLPPMAAWFSCVSLDSQILLRQKLLVN